VTSSVTGPFDSTCHFLSVVHWNPAFISNRFAKYKGRKGKERGMEERGKGKEMGRKGTEGEGEEREEERVP